MRGELFEVWSETWREIWVKLAKHKNAPGDLFCELYRELVGAFVECPDVTSLADIIDNPQQSRIAFMKVNASLFKGELALVEFLERAHITIVDLGDDPLANQYFLLVEKFLVKYSLRYDLRRPFSLHPTLPGIFSRLIHELKRATSKDAALSTMMHEFDESIRDLRADQSSGKIKTCIHKQMNLLEAIAQRCPGVTESSLGKMCNQVNSWPHVTVQEAMKKLYGFSSAYPGIRHAGNPASAIRDIEMRDMVAITVLLAGFVPYLSPDLDSKDIFQGGRYEPIRLP